MKDQADKRLHSRIHAATPIRVHTHKGFINGQIKDLSKGGAAVFLQERVGTTGDSLELFLPFSPGVEISLAAEILRFDEATERGILYHLQFTTLTAEMQEKLLSLIETLSQSWSSSSRKHPRIAKRLPIRYGKLSELQAILNTISVGGLAMYTDSPLVLYQEIEVSIPDASGKELLILPGRVIYQHPMHKEGDVEQKYHVGLQFKELTPMAQKCLEELFNHILDLNKNKK